MKANKSYIDTLPSKYKEQIHKLSSEVLLTVLQDRKKALEYAKKGIEQTEPKKVDNKYISLIADSMQILARLELTERGILIE